MVAGPLSADADVLAGGAARRKPRAWPSASARVAPAFGPCGNAIQSRSCGADSAGMVQAIIASIEADNALATVGD